MEVGQGLLALESGEGQTSFRQTLTRAFAGSHPAKSSGREETCVFVLSYVRQSGGGKQRGGVGTTRRQDGDCGETDLAPNQHGTEDDLQTIKEVVSDDDDCSAPCGPALTGTDGFNAGRCTWKKREC